MERPMGRRGFVALAGVAGLSALGLAGCGAAPSSGTRDGRPRVELVLKSAAQEMNCVSDPSVDNTRAFLERAAQAFCDQYEDADVSVRVRMFALADEVEAVTGSFDTSDAPDVLYGSFFNMMGYVQMGRVVPLDDVISDELRSDIYDFAWSMATFDGKTYMMPFLDMQNVLIYNKRFFGDCGLDEYCEAGSEIQDWTMDQWTEVLDALAQGLPPDVHPLAMYAKNNQGDTHIMSYLRAFGGTVFDEDGLFDFQSPETVEALAWLQEGVERGWYPPHAENLEMKDCSELFSSKKLVIYNFNGANKNLYDDLENYGFVNYPGGVATSFVNGFEVFDNADPEKVRVAKDFLRYVYATPELLDLSAGTLPVSASVSRRYADQILMLEEFEANVGHVVNFTNNSPNWQGSDDSVRSVFYPHIADLLAGRVTPEECAAALDADCNAALEAGRGRTRLHE